MKVFKAVASLLSSAVLLSSSSFVGAAAESCDSIIPSERILPAKVGKTNYCYKIQVKVGGKLYVDTKDPGCNKYNAGRDFKGTEVSNFEFLHGGEALYTGKWNGLILLESDPSLSEATFQVEVKDANAKGFKGILTVPECEIVTYCSVKKLKGKTIVAPMYVPRRGTHCYRVELIKGGIFEYDTKYKIDSNDVSLLDCSNAKFEFTQTLSAVESLSRETIYLGQAPGVIYLAVEGAGEGKIVVSEDPSITSSGGAEMDLVSSSATINYDIDLHLSSCDMSVWSSHPTVSPTVSVSPTASPTESPTPDDFCDSISEYTLPAKFGKSNHCYRIQLENGGKLLVDTKDPGCKKFNAGNDFKGVAVSKYNYSADGVVYYKGTWSGPIHLIRDPSLSEATFEVEANLKTKKFSGTLIIPSCDWTQVGSDIIPEDDALFSGCGWDIDISNDGENVLIGCPWADNNLGSAYLYRLGAGYNKSWNEIASFHGKDDDDLLGHSVSVAKDDASIIAIGGPSVNGYGKVRVYENDDTDSYEKIGKTIKGDSNLGAQFGHSIDLSGNGKSIIVGTYTSGYASIFDFSANRWELNNDSPIMAYGPVTNVCLSEDGMSWGIGSLSGAFFIGPTSTYSDDDSSMAELSGDGKVLVVGDWSFDCGKDNKEYDCGRVKVFDVTSVIPKKIGENIVGTEEGDLCGKSLALSFDGKTVAVGCHSKVLIATLDVEFLKWEIESTIKVDKLSSLAMSSDAKTVALGSSEGLIQVFKK